MTLQRPWYLSLMLIQQTTRPRSPSLVSQLLQQVAKGAAAGVIGAMIASSPVFAADVAAGEQIFNANCAACHAGGQNVIMPDKTLEKEALDQYLAGGRTAKAIQTQVTSGKNAMPAFGGRLSDEDIENVAAYVLASADAGWE
jgi:cytochrome c6